MITLDVKRNDSGRIIEFTVEGHAGFKEAGKDVVCAGVSTVLYSSINGLEKVLGLRSKLKVEGEKGFAKCVLLDTITESEHEKANIILETMVLGIKEMSKQYKKYITVFDKEV